MSWVLNMPVFWIRYGYVWKGYTEFEICLVMAPYASIMPEYALISLNMPGNGWIVNIAEYPWICLKMPE